MTRRRFHLAAIAMIPLLALAACGGNGQPDPGYVRAADFQSGDGQRAWLFTHHASSDSYELAVNSDGAAITRVGNEPWAMLTQTIRSEHLPELAGRRLAFSIDLRGELEDETWGEPFEPTGLIVRMQQRSGGQGRTHALLGSRKNRTARLTVAADASLPQWQRHILEFDTPDDLEQLQVGMIMTTGGTLEFRHPSLRIVGEAES